MIVELINNERKAKKPESWQVGARRVRLMRGLYPLRFMYEIPNTQAFALDS